MASLLDIPIKIISANYLRADRKVKLREKHQTQSLDTGTKDHDYLG